MASYSPRSILRRTSNELLGQYFHGRGMLLDLDIASLRERDIEPVFEAWMAISPREKAEIHSDFSLVDLLADEPGVRAMLDEGEYHGLDLAAQYEEMASFHDQALWTLIEYPRVTEVASHFREAEALPNSYWVRRREGVPQADPRDDEAACEGLSQTLVSYFRLKEGRGGQCQVEIYRRGERYYYFAFPEDYGRKELVYDEGVLTPSALRPAFQVIFVYDPILGALDTFYRGPKKTRSELEKLFAREILGSDIAVETDDRVYDLNLFKDGPPDFIFEPTSGIREVRVKELRLSVLGSKKRRMTVEADPDEGRDEIYHFLDELLRRGGSGSGHRLSSALFNVTKVGLRAEFERGRRKGRPTRSFFLTHPNGCTLRHDGRDEALRQMLIDSGIEPRKRQSAAAAG